jgi:hypothetical protein
MCVALIGAPEGVSSSFRESAARAGFDLWFLPAAEAGMAARIEHLDALVNVDGKVSQRVKEESMTIAKAHCIPAFCASCEGSALCGISPALFN